MFRSTMIALATVAALGAGSITPSLAAGPAPVAAVTQSAETNVVKVGGRHDRGYRGDRHRRGYRGDHHRWGKHGHYRHGRFGRGRTCIVERTRIVRWTPRGKIVRVVPEKICFNGGSRRGWR
ncbi:hypothetical protein [Amorphus orientalis]|uniref:Uncharacterized protein n=1 Tax=Amorphus orientalis TaxID=649198 RepID=A0AAE3VND7_9HYPH|nr:hypothetical protein [Amorphus orientalis]MDQ0315155.1 hypothetical protein [Amorphus orientalis]